MISTTRPSAAHRSIAVVRRVPGSGSALDGSGNPFGADTTLVDVDRIISFRLARRTDLAAGEEQIGPNARLCTGSPQRARAISIVCPHAALVGPSCLSACRARLPDVTRCNDHLKAVAVGDGLECRSHANATAIGHSSLRLQLIALSFAALVCPRAHLTGLVGQEKVALEVSQQRCPEQEGFAMRLSRVVPTPRRVGCAPRRGRAQRPTRDGRRAGGTVSGA